MEFSNLQFFSREKTGNCSTRTAESSSTISHHGQKHECYIVNNICWASFFIAVVLQVANAGVQSYIATNPQNSIQSLGSHLELFYPF